MHCVLLLLFVDFDGLFISNGPGDPQLCQATIANMRKVVCVDQPKPLFGICLGHQLLSLVIGSKTYKMKLVLNACLVYTKTGLGFGDMMPHRRRGYSELIRSCALTSGAQPDAS